MPLALRKYTGLYRWGTRVVALALIAALLWLAYPRIIPLLKNFLPAGYSWSAVILGLVIIALIPFSILALWRIPQWQVASIKKRKDSSLLDSAKVPLKVLDDPSPDEQFSLENEARKTLAQIIGGVFVLLGLFFTAENLRITQQNAERTQKLTEKGQVTDRFTKAIAQLGDSKLEIRVGGIYALEKIAQDNPDDYHWTVMEILSAFVRENASRNKNGQSSKVRSAPNNGQAASQNSDEIAGDEITGIEPSMDIQAALAVIGRRPRRWGERENQVETQELNFNHTDLSRVRLNKTDFSGARFYRVKLLGADFSGANLSGAYFSYSDLRVAQFDGADLREANLQAANLSDAQLCEADLRGVRLEAANLAGANLAGANLAGANLAGANLRDASIMETDLSACEGLSWGQIDRAFIDESTKVPPQFEGRKQEKLKQQRGK